MISQKTTDSPVHSVGQYNGTASDREWIAELSASGSKKRVEESLTTEPSFEDFLSFMLCEEEYGVEVDQVSEVIRYTEILEVPRVPYFIRGIISLRGIILPVFDIKKKVKLSETPITSRSRIVIMNYKGVLYGFLVDSVVGVVSVCPDRMTPPPVGLKTGALFLKGVFPYRLKTAGPGEVDRLLILLNLETILPYEHADHSLYQKVPR